MDHMANEAVATTNDDAALCKYQAVSRGYYRDLFIDKFLSNHMRNSSVRKAPEISRGYYARSASIAYIVEQFLEAHPICQILSLGAGYDSLFWRLKSHNLLQIDDVPSSPSSSSSSPTTSSQPVKFVEIDMNVVVLHKIMAIKRHHELSNLVSPISVRGEALHSNQYHLISFDLRQVDKTSLNKKLFKDCGLDPDVPTLCISECVLVYLPNQDSSSLIRWLSENFTKLTMINYEQCNMQDRFGDIMLAHMNSRHCDLMGVDACKSIATQLDRFVSNGLIHTKSWTLAEIYNKCLLPDEIRRIEELEFLDEKELLDQLLQHYCIVVASTKEISWLFEDNYWLAKTL